MESDKMVAIWVNSAKSLRRCFNVWISILGIGLLLIGLTGCNAEKEASVESSDFSREVEDILERRMDFVVANIANDPRIIELVAESNKTNEGISLSEIERLDARWIATEGIDEFIKGFLTNDASLILTEFQEVNGGYPEIFVTDATGLIVGLTNKTSDYYQADEDWWVQGYNGGLGNAYHGNIEFDESALSEAIALYIPIMDPNTRKAIGVMKVIVDITAIKMEF